MVFRPLKSQPTSCILAFCRHWPGTKSWSSVSRSNAIFCNAGYINLMTLCKHTHASTMTPHDLEAAAWCQGVLAISVQVCRTRFPQQVALWISDNCRFFRHVSTDVWNMLHHESFKCESIIPQQKERCIFVIIGEGIRIWEVDGTVFKTFLQL